MADYVTIANLAASKIGEDDQLRSPDDDTTLGRSVRAVWNHVRQAALRDHSWNFAMRRGALTAAALASIPYPWDASYPLPTDCLRLISVLNRSSREDYQVEGRSILSDAGGPLYIRYVADVDETSLWDALFVEAFACRLAFQIAYRITGDKDVQARKWSEYKAALNEAKRVDARENPQIRNDEPTSWETARRGWGDGTLYSPNGDPVT